MRLTTSRLRLALLPILAAGLIGLAACGTAASSTTGGSTTGGSTTGGAGGGNDALAACLAENGVTMPSGGPGGGGTPPDGGTPPTGSAAPTGAPSAGGTQGGTMAAPPGVDATTWAAAQKACASLAPTPPAAAS